MKKILLLALIISFLPIINPATSQETVSMGSGYIYDVYYSLEDGIVDLLEREDWDLAFYTDPASGGIITNCGTGDQMTGFSYHVKLWTYPNGDTSAWLNIDTNGLANWPLMYNGEDSWENGAFNRNSQGYPDFGWGLLDPVTNDIIGDSIFIIKLAEGTYKQIWIRRKLTDENKYEIRFADIDNTNDEQDVLNIGNYQGMNFAYYDLESESLFEREPATEDWDLVFTRYHAYQTVGAYALVTGVLSNVNINGNRFHPVPEDFNDWFTKPLEPVKALIGWDWKYFSFTTGWSLEDSLLYFVESPNGDIYKIYFTDFAGTSSGDITFVQEMVSMVDIDEASDNEFKLQLKPNPARNTVHLSWNIDPNTEALVRVFDITGKEVMSRKLNQNELNREGITLDISSLNEGMYVVHLESGNIFISEKLIVR